MADLLLFVIGGIAAMFTKKDPLADRIGGDVTLLQSARTVHQTDLFLKQLRVY